MLSMLSVKYHKHLGPKGGICVCVIVGRVLPYFTDIPWLNHLCAYDLQKAVDGYKHHMELCIAHNGYRFEHAM